MYLNPDKFAPSIAYMEVGLEMIVGQGLKKREGYQAHWIHPE